MPTPSTQWQMRGNGYEFCNCDFGCGCNFGGFPNSKDGSCRALVGLHIAQGRCGNVTITLQGCKLSEVTIETGPGKTYTITQSQS